MARFSAPQDERRENLLNGRATQLLDRCKRELFKSGAWSRQD
jgi:hypothetical protein